MNRSLVDAEKDGVKVLLIFEKHHGVKESARHPPPAYRCHPNGPWADAFWASSSIPINAFPPL